MSRKRFVLFLAVLTACCGAWTWPAALAQTAQPTAADLTPDKWPKIATAAGITYTIYQPQLENWDGYKFQARAAVSVLPAGAPAAVFGVIFVNALTDVDRQSRAVTIRNIEITSANFPSSPDSAGKFQANLQQWLAGQSFTPSLDRMQAALAVERAETRTKGAALRNDPPNFVFSQSAAALVFVDGEPVWRPLEGTQLNRLLNTRALILGDRSGKLYLHILDGFVEATGLAGPWTASRNPPSGATSIAQTLSASNVVDLMEGSPDDNTNRKPSLKAGLPEVIVATVPTELVMTKGPPAWAPINGTTLLYVTNTSGNIFKSLNDQYTYVLVTGRWFRARDFLRPLAIRRGRRSAARFRGHS